MSFYKDFLFRPDIPISTYILEINDKYANSKVIHEKHWGFSTWSLKNIQETSRSNGDDKEAQKFGKDGSGHAVVFVIQTPVLPLKICKFG